MTSQRSFKRLVRARMEKTGERYAAARTALLDAEPSATAESRVLPMSDAAIRRGTGRGWEEWFDLLDAWGAADRTHTEIARWVATEHATRGWYAQGVAVGYERASGRRAVGEHADGYRVSATKTVAAPVDRLYDVFLDESLRPRWLPEGGLQVRTATRSKSARFDWGDGATRVIAFFTPKDDGRSTITIQHERLDDADEAERMKSFWRGRVAALKELVEAPALAPPGTA
jgi:uncharacterized protein YndB with AHSA1/START domain